LIDGECDFSENRNSLIEELQVQQGKGVNQIGQDDIWSVSTDRFSGLQNYFPKQVTAATLEKREPVKMLRSYFYLAAEAGLNSEIVPEGDETY